MIPTNACSCQGCQGACEHKPGWFKPDEIAPLAAALGISEQELFDKHLMVDWWGADSDTDYNDVFVLSPAIVNGIPGEEFASDPRGTCRWFVDGKCAIHDQGKPFECAAYHHSDEPKAGSPHHKEAAMAWNNPEAQARIRELLGRDPVAEPLVPFGLFGAWA
jgi:Fe-S-cluster containining protein